MPKRTIRPTCERFSITRFDERLNPSLLILDVEQKISIGTAVVEGNLERHGGKVVVESTPGKGPTFFFTLPAA
ncbi:MAG TPA: hypothetical protein HA263_08960 [Methanoregulaceae archaeon]|nr:hypothetical protein [Methanoregulaceae archaeon]